MMKGRMRRISLVLVSLALAAGGARAQEPTPGDTVAAEAPGPRAPEDVGSTYEPPNARAALLKSMVVPGWGQLSVGAPVRGGIYFGIAVTSWTMLFTTVGRLGEAKDIVSDRVSFRTDSLRAEMALDTALARELSDPEIFDAVVEQDSLIIDKRKLVRARRQQRQDWIAYTLFFTFLNAVDAYVAAQLVDFPADFDVDRRADGSMSIGVRVPAGAGRRR